VEEGKTNKKAKRSPVLKDGDDCSKKQNQVEG
jgi:hypothetical protein